MDGETVVGEGRSDGRWRAVAFEKVTAGRDGG